jgi:hypothetical protein
MARTFALAGVDIIKDDHGIVDQRYSPFAERIPALQAADRRRPRPKRGGRVLRAERQRHAARHACANEDRARSGLPGRAGRADARRLARVRRTGRRLSRVRLSRAPVVRRRARIAPPLLYGKLSAVRRDAVIFVNYGGRFAYARDLRRWRPTCARRGLICAGVARARRRDAARTRRRTARLLRPRFGRGGRVVECTRLESEQTPQRSREFESPPLRHRRAISSTCSHAAKASSLSGVVTLSPR